MDGCEGVWVRYGTNGSEFECNYEYAGDIDCCNCIFGGHYGTQDPRINPYEDEE